MYRIITIEGTEIGIVDDVNYIKIGASGDLATANEEDAIGVSINSTPYNLVGFDNIYGADTVVVSKIDGGSMVYEQRNIVDELILAALEG